MRETRIKLFMITVVLMAIGTVMIYSSSAVNAFESYGDSTYYLKRHLIFLSLGLILSVFFMGFDYGKIRKFIKPFLLISVILLVCVLVPGIGTAAGGARRWIKFSFMNFQPSEVAKMALIFYAADILARKQSDIKNFVHGFMPLMLILGMCVMLILLEPDLGTAVAIGLLIGIMAFLAGARLKHLGAVFLPALPAIIILIAIKPYRWKRIVAFANPWADPQGVGYQITQSFIALGSGGFFGKGLGHSQQKLFYLPEAHTDFIFSIIGEELGFLGAAAIIVMFIIFIVLGSRIAYRARDLFGQFLGFGLVAMIALEVIVNIAAVVGAIPTKGLPLPFISYGGSSLVYNMVSVALLLNIARYRK
ncbi:MAG: putative lipid II flippase FtsW [Candidatus Omnitrophota bacterium]